MGIVHNPALGYRPEIDGLRAVAVIPVILYHAGLADLPGGFVGVDIFFVISGYLITSILLSEMLAGRFSLANFYERRARRILPALFVVMLISLPLAWLLLDPPDFKAFAKSLVAVPTFSSNLLFWLESGYFDASAELKPLLHTWTLAVEEQYYLFFPLLLMLGWRLGRTWLAVVLLIIAVASLVVSQWGALRSLSSAFYLLHARAWELLVGSLIAFYFSWRPRVEHSASALQQGASLAGLALIGLAIVNFDSSTTFPGINALVPTLGAALIILFANQHTVVGRLLGHRWPVLIGMLSYSAYLWHQPVFAFARHASLLEPGLPVMLALAVLSLVLAWLSWRFVEQPFRNKRHISRRQVFGLAGSASVLFAALGLAGYLNNGFAQRFNVDPALLEAFADPTLRDSCDRGYDGKGWNIDFCLFGAGDSTRPVDIALFGDSHSEALLATFDAAARERGENLVHLGLGGCPPLLGVDVAQGNYVPGACETLTRRQFAYVKEHGIKKVVLVSRWTLYTDGDYRQRKMTGYFLITPTRQARTRESSRQVFEQALERTVQAYRRIGSEVIVVAQVPQQRVDPKSLYYRLARDTSDSEASKRLIVSRLSVPVAMHAELQRFTRELFERDARQQRIRLVNLDDAFCQADECLIGDSNAWYKDFNHLNAHGASLLASHISQVLAQ